MRSMAVRWWADRAFVMADVNVVEKIGEREPSLTLRGQEKGGEQGELVHHVKDRFITS